MSQGARREARGIGPEATHLERKSLHERVVDRLRDMIVFGELAPGARIVESDLAERLGVSRTPLREAIKTLTTDGLVDSPINKGARVKPLEAAEIESLFDVIAVLEGLAAERAATRLAESDLKEFETLHSEMTRHYNLGDRGEYFAINSEIHERIVRFAANEPLTDMHRRLMLRARRGRFIAIVSPERWAEALAEHTQLLQAFRRRDGGAAFQIWRKHLENTGRAVLQSRQALEER